MSTDEEGTPPDTKEPAGVSLAPAVQIISLLAFAALGLINALTGNPIDRFVLVGLLAFGIGVRPESLLVILRKAVGS